MIKYNKAIYKQTNEEKKIRQSISIVGSRSTLGKPAAPHA